MVSIDCTLWFLCLISNGLWFSFISGSGIYEESLQNATVNEDVFYDSVWSSFQTFFLSGITLFTLLTTETYPEVMWPTYLAQNGHPYFAYFLVWMLVR